MAVIKETDEGVGNSNNYKRKYVYTTAILTCIIFLLVICLTVSIFTLYERVQNKCVDDVNIESSNTDAGVVANNISFGFDQLNFINRTEWGAEPPTAVTLLKTPVPYVIILHTTTKNCTDQKDCSFNVRNIQKVHLRKWWDIGYSFLIGGDGNIYEGRGWQNEGAFVLGYNSKSIGIAFIGLFNEYLPEEKSINAAKMLIETGVQSGYIDKDYKLYGHKQLIATLSPGRMLYENIKSWPHWTKIVDSY